MCDTIRPLLNSDTMLQFKDLKQGYNAYILRTDTMELSVAKVTAVGFPRWNDRPIGTTNGMVVDITLEANGTTATYVMCESDSAYIGNGLVVTTTKDLMQHEIEAIKNKAEQALSEATRHKQVLDKANTLLADISPEMKREQETETRMQAMEDTLREMQKTLSTLVSELK